MRITRFKIARPVTVIKVRKIDADNGVLEIDERLDDSSFKNYEDLILHRRKR